MSRIRMVMLILWCLGGSVIMAQTDLDYPIIQTANITAFDIDAGLPITCTYDGLLDQNGRLWVNPCYGQPEHRTFSFYQFDGREGHNIEFKEIPADVGGQAVLTGLNGEDELFGFFRDSDDFFFYNPDTGNSRFYSLGQNDISILYMAMDDENALIMYASSETKHFIFRFVKNEVQLLLELRRHHPFEPTREWYFTAPRFLSKGGIWFIDRSYPYKGLDGGWLIRYDYQTKTLHEYPADTLFGEKLESDVFLTMKAIGDTLYRLDHYGWLFSYSLSSGKLNHQHILPAKPPLHVQSTPIIATDLSGNLLLICAQEQFQPTAILRDSRGNHYDYSNVLRKTLLASRYEKTNIRNVFSHDFLKEIMVFVEGGIVVADMKQSGTIQTRFEEHATRGILETGNGKILVAKGSFGLFEIPENGTENYNQFEVSCSNSLGPGQGDLKKDKHQHIWYPWKIDLIEVKSETECVAHRIGVEFERFEFLNDSLIILVGEGQLLYYNTFSGQVSQCSLKGEPVRITGQVNQIFISADNSIWIASLGGLWQINLSSGVKKIFGREQGFHDDRMMCLSEDEQGRIWIGTYAGGLHIFNPKTGQIDVINTSNGLSNNTVIGILKDEEGVRWLSTFSGITLVSPEGNVLTRLYEEDGLSTNEFNRYSSYKDSRKRLLFGSISGLNIITPGPIKSRLLSREALKIYFTSITHHDPEKNADLILRSGFNALDKVKLPAAHRYLKIKFGISSYIRPLDKQFAYRLIGIRGYEGEWTSIGSNPELNLYDLPAGKYEIHIRGSDYRGNVTPDPLVLRVHATEFFYKQIWFYVILFLIISGFGIAWLMYERSERRRLERIVIERTKKITHDKETIEQQAEKLKALDLAKSKLFTNISHEFRTPLTVIEGMADHVTNDPHAPELIKRNTRNLLNLVNQILDLSKLESGALKLQLAQGDVIQFARYISESFSSLAHLKSIHFHFQTDIPALVMDFDEEKLRQVLVNLLSNAIKFTNQGGDVYLKLETSLVNGIERLNISVQDTGIGIPQHEIENIFNQFYQVDYQAGEHFNDPGKGSGIGLTLTSELVKMMSGEINVSSIYHHGSIFTVKIPVTRESGSVHHNHALFSRRGIEIAPVNLNENEISLNHSSDKPSLLIVEDSPDIVHYLISTLKEKYHLHISRNGAEGIDHALEIIPDIIISDVMMPLKDGFELCDTLKNDLRTSHIPIILLTAKADSESRISGLRRGADAYMAKPFDKDEFFVQIENLLEGRKRIQNRYTNIDPVAPSDDPGIQIEDAFISALREVIEANLDNEELQVPEICRKLGMSRAHLHRKLTALTGKSVSGFIRMVRLKKSRELLLNPDMNVSQVAYEVGFRYAETFSRAFHEEYGVSPTQWINSNRKAGRSL